MKSRAIYVCVLIALCILAVACRDEFRSRPYFERLEQQIETGEPPDVGYIDTLRAPEYINEDRLMPLDNLIDPGDLADFYPPLLAHFQRHGNTYAIPRDFCTLALLVNVQLFAQKGLVDENGNAIAPENWEQFRNFAEILTDREAGIFGVGLTTAFWNWMPFMFQAGGSILHPSGTSMTLTGNAGNEALTFYTDLYKDGFAFVPDGEWPYQGIYNDMLDAFEQGEVAMFIEGNSVYNALKERGAPVQVVELPAGPGEDGLRATISYVVGYGLFREPGTELEPGSALDLLRFTTSEEGMGIWADCPEPLYMPTRQSMRAEWVAEHPDAAALMAGVDYLYSYQPATASIEAITDFDQQAADIIGQALRDEITVGHALAELQRIGNMLSE